ncbi:peptide deformylase 1B, chloroplastic isoform X2 [Mangifera indica]|uniref:peptide deformylase 1B, chloroplastic isoform X2 n=1 Tax=Mangifera indica TaxID=29780 RepID=UPI001CFA1E6F|nr:peptide deformylase 1B, chloroplastic isoform X2 [Mangifera indica]
MACSVWLHSSSLSHTLLPVLCRQTTISTTSLRFNRLSSAARFFSSSIDRTNSPVLVQAKRRGGSSSLKEDLVASPSDLHFEAPLKIVKYPNPILRARNKRIVTFDDNLKKLVDEMFDVMYKTDGIGLSAPQVGMNVQLMVFNPVGERGEGEDIVLINPRVNKYSKKKRPEAVKIDAQDINGARFSFNLSGLPARVFQHEFDHLEGILFFDRMTEEVLDSIRIQLQALEKKYEEKTGFPSPERVEARRGRKAAVGFGKS